MWKNYRHEIGSPVYNIPGAIQFKGKLDLETLQRVLEELLERQEALRTVFPAKEGEPVQLVTQKQSLLFAVVDLSHLSEEDRESHFLQLSVERSRFPFDLQRGPLFCFTLFRLGSEEHILLLNLHHMISDGWSVGTLIEEVFAFYESRCTGKAAAFPDLPFQFADYVCWQRGFLRDRVLDAELAYWKRRLGSNPPLLNLPLKHPGSKAFSPVNAYHSFTISEDLTEGLKTLSRRENVTLYISLLVAFKVLLYGCTDQDDMVICSSFSGRRRRELDGLIGFFVKNLPLRTNLSGNPAFLELLQRVGHVVMETYDHQEVSPEQLADALFPDSDDPGRKALSQVLFIYHNPPVSPLQLPGLCLSEREIETQVSDYVLTLHLTEDAGAIRGQFEYHAEFWESFPCHGMDNCYLPSRSSVCGFWIGWIRATPRITFRLQLG
jgi:hypothetical protein